MFRYPIDVIAEREDIEHIEFNGSLMLILFKDGSIGKYKYDFLEIGSIRGGDNFDAK